MHHSFNVAFATVFGLPEAILLSYLEFWIKKNETLGKHFHEGTYWTYNTVSAMGEQFPYLTQYQIRNALKNLESHGLIMTGNFNETPYDRTLWYALTEYGKSVVGIENIEFSKTKNGSSEFDKPIPVREPFTKKENTLTSVKEKTSKARFSPPTVAEINSYCQESGLKVDAEKFIDYYETVGWVVGKTRKPMKSWKGAVRNWARQDKEDQKKVYDDGKPHLPDGSVDWAALARQGGAVFDDD